jgi:bifunctional non-homologous end joining protein LigD
MYLNEGDPDLPVLLNRIKGSTIREKGIDIVACNSKNSFSYLVNRGLTEINLWHSPVDRIDYPDYMVIDLDPSEQNTFAQVKRVAKVLKSVLDKAGAESYCKTSGATGIHVFIPVGVRYPYPIIREFAFTICMLTHKRISEITSMDKKKSHIEHKIHIDYLQNKRGQSISAVYGVRDLPGAPVSTPIAWEELKDDLNPFDFNIFTVPERIKKWGDHYSCLLNNGINIQKCIQSLSSV